MSRRSNRQVARPTPPQVATRQTSIRWQETYSGPLPAPADLQHYNEIVPGMAERLLTKFEQQADHRMALERQVITSDIRRSNAGLLAAFAFGILTLVAAVSLIRAGYEAAGVATIITEFLAFGGIFLYSNISRRRERERKVEGR